MNIEFTTGDVLNSGEPAIAHGCNTVGVMGAGIAKQVRQEHPEAFHVYANACDMGRFRLGSALPVFSSPAGHPGVWIYNLGTQRQPGRDASTWGVFLSFANMAEDTAVRKIDRVAIPRIGCGIGGLTWTEVEANIEPAIELSSNPNLTIVVYDFDPNPKGI